MTTSFTAYIVHLRTVPIMIDCIAGANVLWLPSSSGNNSINTTIHVYLYSYNIEEVVEKFIKLFVNIMII